MCDIANNWDKSTPKTQTITYCMTLSEITCPRFAIYRYLKDKRRYLEGSSEPTPPLLRSQLDRGWVRDIKLQLKNKIYIKNDQDIINCQSRAVHAWPRTFKKSRGVMQDCCCVLTHGWQPNLQVKQRIVFM